MKALSIRQPWAWAIIRGYKDVENRDWKTGRRGVVCIHAPLTVENDDIGTVLERVVEHDRCEPQEAIDRYESDPLSGTGGIIGTVEIVGCRHVHRVTSPWAVGPWCLMLEKPRPNGEIVACKGSLGFWDIPPEVVEAMLLR